MTGVPSGAGPLVLVGGLEWTEGCTFDATLLERSGTDEVVVLATGYAYEDPDGAVARAVAWFEALGARAVEAPVRTRSDALDPEVAAQVRSAGFVYLVGSSPMHLRSVLLGTPVLDALLAAWGDGAVLAGSAAGADVLCDPMVDPRGGAFTVGLGVVPGLAVIPRANTWSADKVHRTVQLAPPSVVVAAIPEATALIRWPDGTWVAEGVGEVSVHLGGRAAGLDALPG